MEEKMQEERIRIRHKLIHRFNWLVDGGDPFEVEEEDFYIKVALSKGVYHFVMRINLLFWEFYLYGSSLLIEDLRAEAVVDAILDSYYGLTVKDKIIMFLEAVNPFQKK
jgi:hypothetical protein